MNDKNRGMQIFNPVVCVRALLVLFAAVLMAPGAMATVTLTVEGVDNCAPLQKTSDGCTTGGTPVNSFRWQVEEDKTYHVPLNPDGTVQLDGGGAPVIDPNWRVGDPNRNTVSVSFHHSYMPVVMNGDETTLADLNGLDSTKNYYISVLPDDGYSIGGAPIKAGQEDVKVYVNASPIPTAQITVFVHEDIAPINNVWDLGETGLEGFTLILEDAGGKYGASAGIQSQDAFGNLLCTTYQFIDSDGDGFHDPGELFVKDLEGNPIVDVPGSGCVTDANGRVTVRNLAPGKYGILAVPPNAVEEPLGSGNFVSSTHTQTSTIEGTKLIDAWVKANEPRFFGEFGPVGPHVNIGFVPAGRNDPYIDATVLTGGATISGQIVNLHLSRAPDTAFFNGDPFAHTTPWVGLNLGAAGLGKGVYAARTNDDGSFSILNVPPGSYQLVTWDDNMDILFAKNTVVVNADPVVPPDEPVANGTCNALSSCNLGDVPVFQWFARMENHIYNDENENGIRDEGELGIIEQAVNLRFRDGTIYQSFPTDGDGFVPFDQVFPFFSWLVAEVDFLRFKATGLTITVDDGGPIGAAAEGAGTNWNRVLTPQVQGNPIDLDSILPGDDTCDLGTNSCVISGAGCSLDSDCVTYRTELGPVLSQGFQTFLGQTSVMEWGKKAYDVGENGGISGVVMYAVTRAEDDPEAAAAEPWEPGIPNVTVNLYDSTGITLLSSTTTDSWDDSLPTNCQYGANAGGGTDEPFIFRGVDTDCYDGLRNSNQVRPGVFDGGYAFGPEIDCAEFANPAVCESSLTTTVTNPNTGETNRYLNSAQYVVEVVAPTGYEIIKSQDRNVDFGDTFFPSPELLPPTCVGDDYVISEFLSLFPGEPAPLAHDALGVLLPEADRTLPLCDQKLVALSNGANAAADFFLFTEVPIAGHFVGFILDDTANEFDPASPQFGEKYAPPFLPVSIRDWTGREISRTVSDEYGVYNALIPSTFTENLGQPSGISPNMLTTCMNAKSKPNPAYDPLNPLAAPQFINDPLHNPQYSQFCYTFQYMPGSTTYLDTPVVPVAAFAGPDQNPLDCEYVTETPRIHSVSVAGNGEGGGPYIPSGSNGRIIITSMGDVEVPNPAYDGVGGTENKAITRNYGFGIIDGTAKLVAVDGTEYPLDTTCVTCLWDDAIIEGDVAAVPDGAYQLVVTRLGGASTVTGITVQVGLRNQANVLVVNNGTIPPPVGVYTKIQDAINDAGNNDLILVAPGTYDELVIMWKPVQLQGWGEGSTTIDAIKAPFNKLADWRILADSLLANRLVSLAPGQELGFGGIEPETFFTEEGAGVFVLAKSSGNAAFAKNANQGARIDGFAISGADTGGGIVVNGYGDYMEISNNRIVNNSAFFAGGVRVGHPMLTVQIDGIVSYSDADNDNVRIHHNTIKQNGGLNGAGGGLALHTGTDSYAVTDNFICGNFTTAGGAGIAHFGFSDRYLETELDRKGNIIILFEGPLPLIEGNTVIFNENFKQGTTVNGGGILVSGLPGFVCPLTGGKNPKPDAECVKALRNMSPGSGSVRIEGNLIQGNSAGVGDGAGIRLARINGQDVDVKADKGSKPGEVKVDWTIDIINNIIVDNVAGLAGGGISLQDALDVNILHNTIANNDNASTSGDAFSPGTPSQSNPQPGAGIVSRAHSKDLKEVVADVAASRFSDANMVDNIFWQNRMFFWELNDTILPTISGLCPDLGNTLLGLICDPDGAAGPLPPLPNIPVYNDLAVIGTGNPADALTCTNCIQTGDGDPMFVAEYVNSNRNSTTVILEGTTSMQAPPAFDEGGNFIRLRYGPLTQVATDTGELFGDYHIQSGSSAIDTGIDVGVLVDFDGDLRPVDGDTLDTDLDGLGNAEFDIGADEIQP